MATDPYQSEIQARLAILTEFGNGTSKNIALMCTVKSVDVIRINHPDTYVMNESSMTLLPYDIELGKNPLKWDAAKVSFTIPSLNYTWDREMKISEFSTKTRHLSFMVPVRPFAEIGSYQGQFLIAVNKPSGGTYELSSPITLNHLANWDISPSVAYIGGLHIGESETDSITIRRTENASIPEIDHIILSDPQRMHADTSHADNGILIQYRFIALAPVGPANGSIDVIFKNKDHVHLRYLAIVLK